MEKDKIIDIMTESYHDKGEEKIILISAFGRKNEKFITNDDYNTWFKQ